MTVRDFVSAVEHFAPARLAFPGDPIGLQLGRPEASVTKLLVSLDPTIEALEFGLEHGCDAWLVHHPLFFTPTRSLVEDTPTAKVAARAISAGMALIGAHTNWDIAPGGINDVLADIFELSDRVDFGSEVEETLYKLVCFCPPESVEKLWVALAAEGAGEIGAYRGCAFISPGYGTFHAGEGTHPAVGAPGAETTVEELRLEMVVPDGRRAAVLSALRKVHPYEQPAYDLLVQAEPIVHRAGRAGRLPRPLSPSDFQEVLDGRLGCRSDAWCPGDKDIQLIGFVGGAASGDWTYAAKLGLDAFVTGEVRQHDAVGAGQSGLSIFAAGHYATENPGIVRLGALVADRLSIPVASFEPEPGRAGRPK